MTTLFRITLPLALPLLASPASAAQPASPVEPGRNGQEHPVYPPAPFAVMLSEVTPPPPLPPSLPLPFDPNAVHSGEGTYYAADGSGNCSCDPSPDDLMVAALNTPDYHGSMLCGAYIEVTGPRGSVVVRVVDRCPECAAGDVDLSPQAFERIAALSAGRVPITWRLLSPVLSGPIVYRFKEGSNPWWTAVQIRNHRNPIYKVEAQIG